MQKRADGFFGRDAGQLCGLVDRPFCQGEHVIEEVPVHAADARNVNRSRAKLGLASLNQTNLENPYLYRTDVRGVDLSKTIGLSQVQLRGSCGDKDTRLPQDLQTPGEWPCKLGQDKQAGKPK